MSGSKLAELAPKFQPQIAVVLMSGYADDEIIRYGLSQGRFTFVQKPFNQDELIRAIHQSVSKTKPVVVPHDATIRDTAIMTLTTNQRVLFCTVISLPPLDLTNLD